MQRYTIFLLLSMLYMFRAHTWCCVQFLGSWWWAEKPPETCRALTVIKNTV